MSENSESTVNNDNGVTYTPSTHATWIKGTVWSIGLGAEVQVIGHSSDQSEDVWMVTRDDDGDGSPDRAIRRAGGDLCPVFRIGDVINILVQTDSSVAPQLTLGLVTSRSARGVYVHTGYSMFNNNGAVCIEWDDARTRFERGEEFQLQHSHAATFLNLLHRKAQEEAKAKADAAIEADRIRDEFQSFKRQVEKVAARYGREHEMCPVLNEALDELGLERISNRWEVTVRLDVQVMIDADNEDDAMHKAAYIIDEVSWSGNDDADPEVCIIEKEATSASPHDED